MPNIRSLRDIAPGTSLLPMPIILSLFAFLLFAATLTIDLAAFRGAFALPVWLSVGNVDDARALLGAIDLFGESAGLFGCSNPVRPASDAALFARSNDGVHAGVIRRYLFSRAIHLHCGPPASSHPVRSSRLRRFHSPRLCRAPASLSNSAARLPQRSGSGCIPSAARTSARSSRSASNRRSYFCQ
jgi:hypothetical protein